MSKQSYRLTNRSKQQSDQESLPEQWTSVQNRLEFLQTTLVKLQKRTQKIQRKLNNNDEELSELKKQYDLQIEQYRKGQKIGQFQREREGQLQIIRNQLQQLHNYTKKIQKKNNDILKDFKKGYNLDEIVQEKLDESIEKKLEKHFKKTKQYIDQAVSQLKNLIKDYAQHPDTNNNKITYSSNDLSRSHSKNKSNNQRSTHSISTSQIKTEAIKQFTQKSFDDKSKCKSPKSIQNNSSSRVSYLREKLKQFQEINKKYEQKTDKKPFYKQEQKYTIQKMKDFKNYLQQSQSQIEQSNLQIKEDNVLTDSIKRWRAGDKYRYQ